MDSVLRSLQPSGLEVCHQVQLGLYLRAYMGVNLRATGRCTWECTVKQGGSVPLSEIGSVLESLPGDVTNLSRRLI